MEPGHITGVHAEVSGLPVPVSAGVTEEQLPELRVYTVATGEQELRAAVPSLNPAQMSTSSKCHFSASDGDA